MGQVVYRGNLKTASMPLLSELFGESIIVKGQDQNYVGGLANKDTLDSAVGVPQIYYCHNVVPTDSGYKSVGYIDHTVAAYPDTTGFDNPVRIFDADGTTSNFTVTPVGNCYVMVDPSTVWAVPAGAPAPALIAGKRVTAALVNGTTYIYFANYGCYSYDYATNTMTAVTLTGLTAADIIGVVGDGGYLVAYSTTAIAWSSVLDPTDFVPSLITGAGGGQVEGVRGTIVTVTSVYSGMLVFASKNAVAAIRSGNERHPYNFIEINGCGGLEDPRYVTVDNNSGAAYAYTSAGLQTVSFREAKIVFPEITDFLSGSRFEDFNENTNELIQTDTTGSVIQKKLCLVANRYLVISYGLAALTHAIFYDLGSKQFSKLKITHKACFEVSGESLETPKKSCGFLTSGGGIKILNADIAATNSSGVMLLGKYQYVRSRLLTLESVRINNINVGDTFSLYDLPSLDGETLRAALVGYLALSSGKVRTYTFHNTALNHTICWKGAFHATSIVITFHVNGRR